MDDSFHAQASPSTCHHRRESLYSEQKPVKEVCSVSEKERNIEQCVEGSMIHQVDSFSLMEKNEKVEGLEGHKHVMGSFSIKEWLEHIRMNNKDQQPPVLVSARMNDPHVRLGDKSLPIELDN